MEELRSTEILDREIEADARKKAERILSKAKHDAEILIKGVDLRILSEKEIISSKYAAKLEVFRNNQNAYLPLERERFFVKFVQTSISSAINSYLEKISVQEKLELLLRQFSRYGECADKKTFKAFVYGFDIDDVKKVFGKKINISSYEKTEFNKIIIENDSELSQKGGVILESEDRLLRCRLTLSELVDNIEDRYRGELSQALFGDRLKQVV